MAKQFRYFEGTFDEKKPNVVRVAFSSEAPVLRMGDGICAPKGERFWEVLDHSPGNQDIKYLQNRGAVLDEHDPKSQIGVVVSAEINHEEKLGRAELEMDSAGLGLERSRQMREKVRPHISFGYDLLRELSCKPGADGLNVRTFSWLAFEISSVATPADLTVGVGRTRPEIDFSELSDDQIKNLPNEQKTMLKRILMLDKAPAEGGEAAATATQTAKPALSPEAARAAERSRVKEITAVARTLAKDHPHCRTKIEEITTEAINGDTSLGDFQVRAMTEILGAKPAKNEFTMEELGMDERDQRSYSILRGIQSCLRRDSRVPDGLEGDVHKEIAKRCGDSVSLEGFGVPHNAPVRCRASRGRGQRDLNVTTFAQGGATVATQIVTPIIEILRNRMVTASLGITTMGGLSGNVAIPRQTGAATAYSLAESATLTKSTQALDQILLSPHRVGAWNDYTRQLLLQSSIDVENFIRDDLMKVLALKWDALILNGQGAGSEPLGVLNTPGIGSVVFGGAATYGKVVDFETALAVLNADEGNMAYATSPSVRGAWKKIAAALTGATAVINGAQNAIWAPSGTPGEGDVNGYRAIASNQIPNNLVIFGNWGEIIHGLYGGYDVIVDPYSRDTEAAVRIVVNSFGDVAIRHAASFCASADAGNQ